MRPDPSTFSRRILVGVTGLTPQVVTETLYGLAVKSQPAFVPTEIHIITSETGSKRINASLLGENQGELGKLCQEYGLGAIRFDATCVHVLQNPAGQPLDDIQTPEQQAWAADAITALIQDLTRDDSAALHVSLAGGRKSMGFFMGYALSLFGRPQDRLSHVLVSEPFEKVPDFFYPPRVARELKTSDGAQINTAQAHVVLADIPFVQMRHNLPPELLRKGARFSDAVEAAGETVGPPTLVFDEGTRTLRCGGIEVPMEHYQLALYVWLARRASRGEPQNGAISLRDADVTGFLSEYRQIAGRHSASVQNAEENLAAGFDAQDFRSKVSHVKTALVKALGVQGAEPYLIQRSGIRGRSIYGLNGQKLSAADIRFKPAGRAGSQT